MTDLFDLSTLSALAQHFASVDDVNELKSVLAKVQDDMSAIKNFLESKCGANFSDSLGNNSSTKVPVIRKLSSAGSTNATTITVNGGVKDEQLKMKQVPAMNRKPVTNVNVGGLHSKPPPLLRFRGGDIVENGSDKGNMSSNRNHTAGVSLAGAGVKKPERFQRNFLSMNSLRSSAAPGINMLKTRLVGKSNVSSSFGSGIRGNGSVNSAIKIESESSSDIHEESFAQEDLKLRNGSSNMYKARSMSNGIYNLPEVDMEDIDEGAEGENYDYDGGQLEEDENAEFALGDSNDQGAYDDSSYMEIPDDNYNYEEDYSVDYGSDGLEIIDVRSNNSNFKIINQDSSAGGQVQGRVTSKRAQLRRITPPDNDGSLQKECKVCHEAIPSDALFSHVISTHYNGEIPTCQMCKKTFTYRQGLISHMRYHDADKYDKACSYCGKRFIRKSDVIIHERRLHTGERPYQCPAPDCNQGFVRRYCLLTHVKTNHGEPYMSQIKADAGKRRKSS
ncbi:unnamed protein product [Orchesella dallaii]|uniref:C2H2-type domain-containing protein n=1 Tax=Orchesella dallaii TaxID=48710 RepID=A0ABP1RB39_9HEXA